MKRQIHKISKQQCQTKSNVMMPDNYCSLSFTTTTAPARVRRKIRPRRLCRSRSQSPTLFIPAVLSPPAVSRRRSGDPLPVELRQHGFGGRRLETQREGEPRLTHCVFHGAVDHLLHLPYDIPLVTSDACIYSSNLRNLSVLLLYLIEVARISKHLVPPSARLEITAHHGPLQFSSTT